MTPNDIPPEYGGPLGSLVALLFLREVWPRRIAMGLAGCLLAWYGAVPLTQWLPVNEGFAGFLIGLFGMAGVSKLFDVWHSLNLGELFSEWLRVLLRLPPKQDKES